MVKIALDAEDSGKEGVLGEFVDGLQREQPQDDVSPALPRGNRDVQTHRTGSMTMKPLSVAT